MHQDLSIVPASCRLINHLVTLGYSVLAKSGPPQEMSLKICSVTYLYFAPWILPAMDRKIRLSAVNT
jgi:hypothetical protein